MSLSTNQSVLGHYFFIVPHPLVGALSDDAVWRLSVCRIQKA